MQVIAFISGKGGVGKSTLAANVAVALGARKKRVMLIDLDPQNVQRLHLGMDPDEIAGLVREGIGPDSVFDSPFGIQFIPFGRVTDVELDAFETELKRQPNWVADSIASLDTGSLDVLILDTPPGATVFLQQALRAANRALTVLLPDAASYASIPKILSLLEYHTEGRENFYGAYFLINQMPQRSKLGHQIRSALYANYANQMVPVAIHKDVRFAQALAFEQPVVEYEPASAASTDVQHLVGWLLDTATE
jgi:cellulose synthase operon protein YhjQ